MGSLGTFFREYLIGDRVTVVVLVTIVIIVGVCSTVMLLIEMRDVNRRYKTSMAKLRELRRESNIQYQLGMRRINDRRRQLYDKDQRLM